MNFNVD